MMEISSEVLAHEAGLDKRPLPLRLPLNSKRLIRVYLQAISKALEGKLGDEDREPLNTQVIIEEDHAGAEIVSVIDADGVF